MSTATMPRPPSPSPARPGAATQATVSIDPLKLIQKHKWVLTGAAITGIVLGIAMHYVLLATAPIYKATVLWECFNQEKDVGTPGGDQGFSDELEKFMATQAALMKSDRIISLVLDDPRLARTAPEWQSHFMHGDSFDKNAAASSLDFRLSAGIVGDSNLVRLSFWDTDKNSALGVARLVSDVFESWRKNTVTTEQGKRRDSLKKAIDNTESEIATLQSSRAAIMVEAKLDTMDASSSKATSTLRTLSDQLAEAGRNMELYKTRLDKMESELNSPTGPVYTDDIREAANNAPEILYLKQNINQIDGEVKAMTQRLGENAMDTVALRSRLEGLTQTHKAEYEKTLRRVFDSQLEQLRMGLSSTMALQANIVAKIDEEIGRANDLAKVMEKVDDIRNSIATLTKIKSDFMAKLSGLQALSELDSAYRIRIVQEAALPRTVSFPKLYIMIPLGFFLVMGLAVGLIVLVEIVDQRVKGPSDIDMITKVRCIGLIPHAAEDPASPQKPETVFRDAPQGVMAENFRQARGAILKRMDQAGHKSLVVLGGLPGSGATTIAVNLAFAAAAAERKVLLIDGNFRRPALHKVLGLQERPGLADVLAGTTTLEAAVQISDDTMLHVLTVGASDPRSCEKLGAASMGNLLKQAEEDYDLVIVDGPPAVVAEDGVAAANRADASLLVVRALSEKRGMVARLRNQLGEGRGDFLGVLINAARSAAGGYLRGNIQATHRYTNGKE
ncbi:MAG: AAA family ATPase [Phycisphaerales bacterium]|nr:AAA family ATPase [Phycisphaerales bacterium]